VGRLRKELERIRSRGDSCLLTGDINKLVRTCSLGIPGNHPEVPQGCHLVRDLGQSGDWLLINSMEGVVKGGPFTRRDQATALESCQDLWICPAGLPPYVKSLEIERERRWPGQSGGRARCS
jgi:hypothetical protein